MYLTIRPKSPRKRTLTLCDIPLLIETEQNEQQTLGYTGTIKFPVTIQTVQCLYKLSGILYIDESDPNFLSLIIKEGHIMVHHKDEVGLVGYLKGTLSFSDDNIPFELKWQ